MVSNEKQLHQIYHNLLAILLTFAVVYGVDTHYQLHIPAVLVLLLSILVGASIAVILNYKRLPMTYVILFGFILILLGYLWIQSISIKDWIIDWYWWIYKYDKSMELYSKQYGLSSVIALIFIFNLVFIMIVQYRLTLLITAFFTLAALILCSVLRIDLPKPTLAISLFYLYYIAIKEASYYYHRKKPKKEKSAGILYLVPIGIIFILFISILPTKAEPIRWEPVKHAYQNIGRYFKDTWKDIKFFVSNSSGDFAIAMTGYNEEGATLSQESIKKTNEVALSILAYRLEEAVYLSGSVRNHYTGEKWTTEEIPKYERKEYELDYAQMVYLASMLNVEDIKKEQWIKRLTYQIQYEDMNTKTMFYPMNLENYSILSKKVKVDDDYSTIKFQKNMGNKTKYSVSYYKYNLASESLQDIFRNSSKYALSPLMGVEGEKEWIHKKDVIFAAMIFDYHINAELFQDKTVLKQLYQREQDIYQYYTALPEDLPQRVYDLGREIGETASNDYDRLKAIEFYLSKLEYSTEPGKTTKGHDFVDYFLFDSKKGFCTSFASAMAVLGRTMGIPTRYVEGFVADLSEYDYKQYKVRNHKAHAWVEAYIKGVGWVAFEPTPIYQEDRYQQWKPRKEKGDLDMDFDYLNRDDMVDIPDPNKAVPIIELLKEKETEEKYHFLIYLLASLPLIVMLIVITYIILNVRLKVRYRKASDNEKFYLCFLRILFLLKKEGYSLNESETIQMYAKRVPKQYCYSGTQLQDIADQYMDYRYGEVARTKEHIAIIELYLKGLENHRRERLSRLKYGWEKFQWSTGR